MKTKYQDAFSVPHGGDGVNSLLWQVCHYRATADGLECVERVIVRADSIKAVYTALADYQGPDNVYRVYPYTTGLADGDGITRLAEYALYHVRRYALANGKAALAELKRSIWDLEDEKSTASLAICDALAENPEAGMDDLYIIARRAVERERDKLYHVSAMEYNPDWAYTNPYTQDCIAKQTDNAMSALLRYGVRVADLTEKQDKVARLIADGYKQKDIMQALDMGATMYKRHRDNALHKVLLAMIDADGRIDVRTSVDGREVECVYLETFARYGLTSADVFRVADDLAEKVRKNKGKK